MGYSLCQGEGSGSLATWALLLNVIIPGWIEIQEINIYIKENDKKMQTVIKRKVVQKFIFMNIEIVYRILLQILKITHKVHLPSNTALYSPSIEQTKIVLISHSYLTSNNWHCYISSQYECEIIMYK